MHVDSVLEYNEDPAYMADLTLYRLTQAAQAQIEKSGLSIRELTRSLGTSPTQLYRLIDPTNHTKSLRQLMALLNLLGCDVDVEIKERRSPGPRPDAARRPESAEPIHGDPVCLALHARASKNPSKKSRPHHTHLCAGVA